MSWDQILISAVPGWRLRLDQEHDIRAVVFHDVNVSFWENSKRYGKCSEYRPVMQVHQLIIINHQA